MTTPKKTDPLTVEEVAVAADNFFELFDEVLLRCNNRGISTEEAVKLSESIFAYAHKLRAIDAEASSSAPFGFNKGDSAPPPFSGSLQIAKGYRYKEDYDSLPIDDIRRWTHV